MTPFDLAEISKAILDGYGIELRALGEGPRGHDPSARTYKAKGADGDRWFIKECASVEPGIALVAALAETGIDSVLAPIRTRRLEAALPFQDRHLLVFPYLQGQNGFARTLSLPNWREVGSTLRKVHDAELPRALLGEVAGEEFAIAGLEEFERTASKLLASTHRSPAEEALAGALSLHQAQIHQAVRRVRELGEACRARSWDLVPCHADLHVGNILVADEDEAWLIDWDAPRLAPRECDLVFFLNGGILGAHGEAEEAAFRSGYGEVDADLLALTYYRYARAAEDLVAYTREVTEPNLLGVEDPMEGVAGFEALFAPNCIVDAAFRSDERLAAP